MHRQYLYVQTDVLKAKLAAIAQLHSTARQSDGQQFDYFRHNLLQPFLITRVSDTEGSRQVQQVHTVHCHLLIIYWSIAVDFLIN